ncbi:MAG: sialidase family protein [Gemmatimonadota bacterium]
MPFSLRLDIAGPLSALSLVVLAGCTTPDATQDVGGTLTEIDSPAGPFSGEPFLRAGGDGVLHMTWIERTSDSSHAVRYASLAADRWTTPQTVVERSDLFVNWADFPAIVETTSGRLFVHWLQRSGSGRYSYDIRFAQSTDGGVTWSTPAKLNADTVQAEHGFVALWPATGDSIQAAWLDGRAMTATSDGHGRGSMQVLTASVGADGGRSTEYGLDVRSCECCQVNAAVASGGPVVVYRDRSESEIRDIALVRRVGGQWTAPRTVHDDGWRIEGCPVNGPAIAAAGDNVVVAWFTGAADTARVLAAFSGDGGATFAPPVRIDGGSPAGRTDVRLLAGGDALVSWLERVDSTAAEVRLRRVTPQGEIGGHIVLAATSGARASGFPRIELLGDVLYAAWTVPGDTARVRLAALPLTAAQ